MFMLLHVRHKINQVGPTSKTQLKGFKHTSYLSQYILYTAGYITYIQTLHFVFQCKPLPKQSAVVFFFSVFKFPCLKTFFQYLSLLPHGKIPPQLTSKGRDGSKWDIVLRVSGAILWTISEHAFRLQVALCVSLQSLYMNARTGKKKKEKEKKCLKKTIKRWI